MTQTRWLLNSASPDDVYIALRQEGQDAVVSVELDPERGDKHRADPPHLVVVPPSEERSQTIHPDFVWTGPNSLQARFRLEQIGTYRTLVKAAGKGNREFVRGPSVTLPYSPEFAPRQGLPSGRELLTDVAKLSNGRERTDILSVLADPPRSVQLRSLLPYLFTLGLLTLMLEIAGRRLSWWETFPWWRRQAATSSADLEATTKPTVVSTQNQKWWQSWKPKFVKLWPTNAARKTTTSVSAAEATLKPQAPVPKPVSAADLFEQAKKRASKRVK